MQGLPSQILPKSSKAEAFGDKKVSVKTESGKFEVAEDNQEIGSAKGDQSGFASLFANLTKKDKAEVQSSDGKSQSGEALKNLLNGKNNSEESSKVKVEEKILSTASNLDQLLNKLKNSQNPGSIEEGSENEKSASAQNVDAKKLETETKNSSKLQSPLDFLMKGVKPSIETGKTEVQNPKDTEALVGQKKMMTGEDYLKNMDSSEKKVNVKPVLLNNLADLQKNNPQNVKAYGQGLSLLSDPLIRNTKDLAFKETKEAKKGNSAISELRTPETKIGAELSAIKQDVIPELQNNKSNHGQSSETQTQANQKVLDLGKINTANVTEIIKKISDYVEQNQVANKSSLDLTVKHESLGEFKIQVTKMPSQSLNQAQNLVDMQITTSSKEGQDFFVKNEVSLMKNLSQAGINLSDLRIISTMSETNSFGQSDSKQSSSFSQNPDGSEKQFMSFESNNFSTSSDSRNGSERRKELWEEYQQRYGA